jgi:hypothetical protein
MENDRQFGENEIIALCLELVNRCFILGNDLIGVGIVRGGGGGGGRGR